jgi:hypothetical protein
VRHVVRDSFAQMRNEHEKSMTISVKGCDRLIRTHASFIPLLHLKLVYAMLE